MKKTIIIAIALLWQGIVFAQCDDKGISTDPRDPNNIEKPVLKTIFFGFLTMETTTVKSISGCLDQIPILI